MRWRRLVKIIKVTIKILEGKWVAITQLNESNDRLFSIIGGAHSRANHQSLMPMNVCNILVCD